MSSRMPASGTISAWRSRRGALATIALVFALLAGCASPEPPPDMNTATAAQLQTSVLAVTQDAAAGDIAGAIAQLDALQSQLREATAAGIIDPGRSARIQAAIDLVRADLVAALPPSPEPEAPVTDNSGNNGNGSGNDDNGGDDDGGGKGDKGGGKGKDKP